MRAVGARAGIQFQWCAMTGRRWRKSLFPQLRLLMPLQRHPSQVQFRARHRKPAQHDNCAAPLSYPKPSCRVARFSRRGNFTKFYHHHGSILSVVLSTAEKCKRSTPTSARGRAEIRNSFRRNLYKQYNRIITFHLFGSALWVVLRSQKLRGHWFTRMCKVTSFFRYNWREEQIQLRIYTYTALYYYYVHRRFCRS